MNARKRKNAMKKFAISAAAASSQLTVFQQFAVAATFDTAAWQSFMGSTKTTQQGLSQTLVQTRHSNSTPHNNYSYHSNNGPNNYDNPGHENCYPHVNSSGTSHNNSYAHTNGGVGTGHFNHTQTTSHTNHNDWHRDRYTQHQQHSNTNPHNNHSNHNNTGFNHDNFVPSKPEFYNLSGRIVGGTVKVAFYSYDKNIDGFGTQDAQSKDVYYDLFIRKVGVATWTQLVNNQLQNSGEGFTYDLNTTSYVDGDYQIMARARNATRSGVTYQSPDQIITVTIKQNQSPGITVLNGSEFINFTFGIDGALSPAQVYKRYMDGLYGEGAANQQDGIFVKISMQDPDKVENSAQNWQKGRIYLRNPSGVAIAGASSNIVWADTGTTITSSQGDSKIGVAFIPKSVFTAADMVNAKVVVEVTDYKDAACTIAAGTAVTQTTVSSANLTQLNFNVDVTKPTVVASSTDYTWKTTDFSVGLTYNDTTSGILKKEYQVTNSPTPPTGGWIPYTSPISFTEDGQYYIWYRAVDKVENEQIGYFGSYKLDKTAPLLTFTQSDVPGSDAITITATGTDDTSGVKRIQLPNGTWVNGSTASYTVTVTDATPFIFKVEDNAGNVAAYTVTVNPAPMINGLRMVDLKNPPAGTVLPVTYPVSVPTRIKTGYKMTLEVATKYADKVEIHVYANGSPLMLYSDSLFDTQLTVDTVSRLETTTNITFWLDKELPLGTVLDVKVIGHRIRTDGTYKSTVDTARGDNFAIIVGSSLQDSDINLTH